MSHKCFFLACFISLFSSCLDAPFTPSAVKLDQKIQPCTTYPSYWSWDGQNPVLLLGAGGKKDLYLDPDYEQKINLLSDNGGNFIQVTIHLEWVERDMAELLKFLAYAEQRAVVVELTITTNPVKFMSTTKLKEKKRVFKELVKKTGEFQNVLYHIALSPRQNFRVILERQLSNVPIAGIDYERVGVRGKQAVGFPHWQQLQDSLVSEQTGPQIVHLTDISNKGQTAAEGIAAFNRSVMAGAAVVRHSTRAQGGEGFTGPALAGIRAIRTIEHHFNFWELTPAPQIVPTAAPNEAYAMADGKDGFLIYLPTAGSVYLRLGLAQQIPLRVSVVGYLGTQKSELLEPPYDDGFTLYTEEPRGGWMIIKPAR